MPTNQSRAYQIGYGKPPRHTRFQKGRSGNPRLWTTMIPLAWLWLRHQGQSALARWFKAHSQRGRKSAIVALARKLLVALWKYVAHGVVIEGAVMKSV